MIVRSHMLTVSASDSSLPSSSSLSSLPHSLVPAPQTSTPGAPATAERPFEATALLPASEKNKQLYTTRGWKYVVDRRRGESVAAPNRGMVKKAVTPATIWPCLHNLIKWLAVMLVDKGHRPPTHDILTGTAQPKN